MMKNMTALRRRLWRILEQSGRSCFALNVTPRIFAYVHEKIRKLTGLDRSERQSMPTFHTAPNTYTNEEIYESGIGDSRGYYEDDAYVGRASTPPIQCSDKQSSVEPQEAYTITLKDRFLKQRHQLRLHPGPEALAALGDKYPISFPANNNKAYAEWHRLLRGTAPQPSQIRALEQDTCSRLLELIQKHFLQREKEIMAYTSAWIWSLFARLDEVGNMNNGQVSLVREFGKKAVLVQLSFSDPVAAEQLERASVSETSISDKSTVSNTTDIRAEHNQDNIVSRSKDTPASSESDSKPVSNKDGPARQNTLATLDAVIVLVGDVFGQRDLLEFRQPWSFQKEGTKQGS